VRGSIPAGERLNASLIEAGLAPLELAHLPVRFEEYLSLILRWNARVNLTAIRDEDGILSRHFVESIACARALPAGISTLAGLWLRRRVPRNPHRALPSRNLP
jgi:16S rRNA (guanine527-N7)-methyltransferase